MQGTPQRQLNVELARSFHVTKEQNLYFRVESYNVTNTPSFQPPDGNLEDTTLGPLSSTGNMVPRQFQFGLKYIS